MNDLISRSKVISVLEQLEEHSLTGKMYISNAIYLLNNQPTAYDIDKVVEELKQQAEQYRHRAFEVEKKGLSALADKYYGKQCSYEHAIEIVKQGGVSDDVCEYRITDKMVYASCNNKQIASAFCWFNECGDYKYCPYCGKKIKVVE